jgi:hypothetical protein
VIRWATPVVAMLLLSCAGSGSEGAATQDSTTTGVLPDSLASTAPGGVEIWFTLARPGRTPEGTPCIDRAVEIRHGATRTPVPLLYTGEVPRIVNESTARAILYTRCRAGEAYLVDLRSGRPIRERK